MCTDTCIYNYVCTGINTYIHTKPQTLSTAPLCTPFEHTPRKRRPRCGKVFAPGGDLEVKSFLLGLRAAEQCGQNSARGCLGLRVQGLGFGV